MKPYDDYLLHMFLPVVIHNSMGYRLIVLPLLWLFQVYYWINHSFNFHPVVFRKQYVWWFWLHEFFFFVVVMVCFYYCYWGVSEAPEITFCLVSIKFSNWREVAEGQPAETNIVLLVKIRETDSFYFVDLFTWCRWKKKYSRVCMRRERGLF